MTEEALGLTTRDGRVPAQARSLSMHKTCTKSKPMKYYYFIAIARSSDTLLITGGFRAANSYHQFS